VGCIKKLEWSLYGAEWSYPNLFFSQLLSTPFPF
jgi:hypothetical protein